MTMLVGISGSLRQHSYNTGLLRAAQEMMPSGTQLQIVTLEGIPLYNADLETSDGIPSAVSSLKDAIASADGVLLATPEYNNGIPGVFKNAIDWASRPPADISTVFRGKPFALIGTSPGGFGTILSQSSWLPVLRTLGAELWAGGRLMVPGASKVFDDKGLLVDEAVRLRLAKFVSEFIAAIR